MTLNYHKVWQAMNDLEDLQTHIATTRATLEAALDYEDENMSRKLVEASMTQLDHYLNLWDEKFQRAWNKTVMELKYQDLETMRVPPVPTNVSIGYTESEENQ